MNSVFISDLKNGLDWTHFESLGLQFTNTSKSGLLRLTKTIFLCLSTSNLYCQSKFYQQSELHSVSPECNCVNRAIVSFAGGSCHWFLREESKGIFTKSKTTSCPLSTPSNHQSTVRVTFWKRKTLHFFSRLSKKSVTLRGKWKQ